MKKILYSPLTKLIIGALIVIGSVFLGRFLTISILGNFTIGQNLTQLVTRVVMAVMAFISYTLLFRSYEKRKIEELSFENFWFNAGVGFSTGLILQTLTIFVIFTFGGYAILHINNVFYLLPGLVISLSVAIFEEILFRGVLFRLIEEKLGSIIALIISALIFGFIHLTNKHSSIYSALAISIEAGILLGAAFIYSKNLWLPIFLHFSWNFAEGSIFGANISGHTLGSSLFTAKFTGSVLLTGGFFGPENSIQAIIFCLIAGIAFLILAKKQNKFVKPFWKINQLSAQFEKS